MSIKSEIISTLEGGGIETISSVTDADLDGASYLVFIPIALDKNGKKSPSGHKLGKLREKLKAKGIDIEYVLTDGALFDLESGLRAALMMSHNNLVRNVFLQLKDRTGNIWIEPKQPLTSDAKAQIKTRASAYLKNFDLDAGDIVSTAEDNIPTITASLKAIRLLAPIKTSDLAVALSNANFVVPSDDWVRRRLDQLRKKGLVVRRNDGAYVLSLAGLRALGTRRDRASPDVVRLLALARGPAV